MRHLRAAIIAAACLLPASLALAQGAIVPKTNPKKVYVHYQPWYETPFSLGASNFGWHWTMNNRNPNVFLPDGRRQIASHYYPSIGTYDSTDPDYVEYACLLMKLSGVDGVVINWYGVQGSNPDVPSLLAGSNAMADRVGGFGMKFSVALEDRFSRDIADAQANVAYLRDHYFNRPSYLRTAGDQPFMAVFGPITFQQPAQWGQILSVANQSVDVRPLWYQSGELGSNADGEFAWIYENEAQDDHLVRQQNFLQHRAPTLPRATGVAYPAFNDFYQQGGTSTVIGFNIPSDAGQTFQQTLGLHTTFASRTDMVQIATWNDFGEGTQIEPTREDGFAYLRQLQQWTGTPYGTDELSLVVQLFNNRKQLTVAAKAQLDVMAAAINNLDFPAARAALRAAVGASLPSWNLTGSGRFDAPAGWRQLPVGATFPNSLAAAYLGPTLTRNATVFTETSVTLSRLDLASTFRYELAGPATLTLQGLPNNAAQINVLLGHHKLNLITTLASDTALDTAPGTSLLISNPLTLAPGVTLTKSGSGTLTVQSPMASASPATLKVTGGTVNLEFSATGGTLAVLLQGATLNLASAQTLGPMTMAKGSAVLNVGRNSGNANVSVVASVASLDAREGVANTIHTTTTTSVLNVADNIFVDRLSNLTCVGVGTVTTARVLADGLVAVNGGTLRLRRDSAGSAVSILTVAAPGVVDLTNNDLVLRTASIATVRAWLDAGRMMSSSAGSATTGDTRDLYATLAVVSNTDPFGLARFATFAGIPVAATDTLVKYTYLGDTDLNGLIDARDLGTLLRSWSNNTINAGWAGGDTNYDGVVDGTDYLALLNALAHQGAPFTSRTGTAGGAVPDPATGTALWAPATLLLRRNRRRP